MLQTHKNQLYQNGLVTLLGVTNHFVFEISEMEHMHANLVTTSYHSSVV